MKQTNDKAKINQVFMDWFEGNPEGTEFKLIDMITHARNRTTLYYRLDDTFRRYLMGLREDGIINFTCISKMHSLYKSVK